MDLRDYLKKNEIALSHFAKNVGASQPTLWRYAHGERPIPAALAVRIERATKGAVTVESLVSTRKRKRG